MVVAHTEALLQLHSAHQEELADPNTALNWAAGTVTVARHAPAWLRHSQLPTALRFAAQHMRACAQGSPERICGPLQDVVAGGHLFPHALAALLPAGVLAALLAAAAGLPAADQRKVSYIRGTEAYGRWRLFSCRACTRG